MKVEGSKSDSSTSQSSLCFSERKVVWVSSNSSGFGYSTAKASINSLNNVSSRILLAGKRYVISDKNVSPVSEFFPSCSTSKATPFAIRNSTHPPFSTNNGCHSYLKLTIRTKTGEVRSIHARTTSDGSVVPVVSVTPQQITHDGKTLPIAISDLPAAQPSTHAPFDVTRENEDTSWKLLSSDDVDARINNASAANLTRSLSSILDPASQDFCKRGALAKSTSQRNTLSETTLAKEESELTRSRLIRGCRKRGVYNHRSWQRNEKDCATNQSTIKDANDEFHFEDDDNAAAEHGYPKLSSVPIVLPLRAASVPISDLAILRNKRVLAQKSLYTVIRHVSDASECQELGETQDFLDEVEYHVDGLRSEQNGATRALSALSLAEKCVNHSFRLLMKSHSVWTRVFQRVADCTSTPRCEELCLSVAGLLYIMSCDRSNCELNGSTLGLILQMLDSSFGHRPCIGAEQVPLSFVNNLCRTRRKLQDILVKFHSESFKRPKSAWLQYATMTSKDLAMEALLVLSVRKASDWFKDEVRLKRGLDHIVEAVGESVNYFGSNLSEQNINEMMLDRLRRIEAFLRVLENMTYKNTENQCYVVQLERGKLLEQLRRCLVLCHANLAVQQRVDEHSSSSERRQVTSCLLAVIRLLLNCSHDNSVAAERLGSFPDLTSRVLECVLRLPKHLSAECGFELLVLALGFLVNLTEHCEENRRRLAHIRVLDEDADALEVLVELFQKRDKRARELEVEAESAKEASQNNAQTASATHFEEMQWRVVEEGRERRRRRYQGNRVFSYDDEEEDGEESEEEDCADIEFLPSTREEDERLQSALTKASQHMQESMVAAYTALLLGCLVRENQGLAHRLLTACGEPGLRPLVAQLANFLSFVSLTSAVSSQGVKSILGVLKLLDQLNGSGETPLPLDRLAAFV